MSLFHDWNRSSAAMRVPNLTVILIVGQVFLYVAQQLNPGQAGCRCAGTHPVVSGQRCSRRVWRLVTFLFDPPMTNLFCVLLLVLVLLDGNDARSRLGARFATTCFLLVGYVASVACAFAVVLCATAASATCRRIERLSLRHGVSAFARLFPDFVMYILFILPVKIKWLALLQWIGYALGFLFGDWMMQGDDRGVGGQLLAVLWQ